MYIKVAYGDHQSGDFLLDVTGPIHSGLAAIKYDPEAVDNDVVGELGRTLERARLRELGQDQSDDLIHPIPFNHAHVLTIDPAQTKYERRQGLVGVQYAWWDEPMDGLHVVITTRPIYILGDNGKTIDKVR